MTIPMTMRAHVEDYLAMRRSLGYQLHGEGRMLLAFADRLDQAGQRTITVSAALAWASEPTNASPAHWSRRLTVVRVFSRHLHALDPTCEIPPTGLLPARSHRPMPYIYTGQEVAALVHAAGTIAAPMHSATCHAVISLITACGLRLGETLALDRADVDLSTATITVVGKNQQTRRVPLHSSTAHMLARYAARRDRLCRSPACDSFFLTATGHRPLQRGLQESFAKLLVLAEIPTPAGRRRPRMSSRPGARFWCCHQPVSPNRSPNPPYRSLGNGLSTASAVKRGSW
ncbi:hypothetical protein GCM10009555_050330 [Acrocarpospora macrocephala]|uniref:Tyr recombinase domain-containing protein n=1 Tax=Acrocarpospora macrocephala TaxID=150177 RepID=A0A5M3WWS7_9ACTN|nr:tyrosine-type recombinase/integrase [Acrocarpospora macrocephala]GES12846.1 hypothetical protein Amac_064430 [Acrocarpospora macrocephala]